MNNILIYTRAKASEPAAEQTAHILADQLHQLGLNAEISHVLNIPRLILNSYHTVHMIVDSLPLTVHEVFHLALCRALGKSSVLSVLNSDKRVSKNLLDFIKPDALSVSQTNHLKYYRSISCTKFIFPAFPALAQSSAKKSHFNHEGTLIPLMEQLDEATQFKLDGSVYFDGRKLIKKSNSALLRKKWTEMISQKQIGENFHLILSESKVRELLRDGSLAVVLADPNHRPSEISDWLSQSLNHSNLMVLNEYQATGFSSFWTSGQNSYVLNPDKWVQQLNHLELSSEIASSHSRKSELFETSVNELSRLYSKLWHQKTSLLTSRSVKL